MQPIQNIGQLTTLFLNTVDDLFPGGGDIAPGNVPGQLGKIFFHSGADALLLSDTAVGTLLGGMYQYVKFKAAPTTAAAKGLCVVWSNRAAFEVSVDVAADIDNALIAGVALSSVTSGQHGFIQMSGSASVKVKGTTTKGTPVIGDDLVTPLNADNGLADVLADATAVVFGTAAAKHGRVFGRLEVAVDGDDIAIVQLVAVAVNSG